MKLLFLCFTVYSLFEVDRAGGENQPHPHGYEAEE